MEKQGRAILTLETTAKNQENAISEPRTTANEQVASIERLEIEAGQQDKVISNLDSTVKEQGDALSNLRITANEYHTVEPQGTLGFSLLNVFNNTECRTVGKQNPYSVWLSYS